MFNLSLIHYAIQADKYYIQASISGHSLFSFFNIYE